MGKQLGRKNNKRKLKWILAGIVIALLLFGSFVVLLDHGRIVQPVVDVAGPVAQAAVHLQKHTPDRSAHHQTHRNRCVEAVQQAGLPDAIIKVDTER